MGVQSSCVKFYLVHDLWRAWRWRGKEIGTRCLDHDGVCVWLYLGCGYEAGVRVCPSAGKLPIFSGLLWHPVEGNGSRGKRRLSLTTCLPPRAPPPRLRGSLQGVRGDFGFTLTHKNGSNFFPGLQSTRASCPWGCSWDCPGVFLEVGKRP